MPALGLLVPIALLLGLFLWFRRSGGEMPASEPQHGRVSLLTEAVGYVGAILMLAGGGVAIAQRWEDLSHEVRLALLAGVALLFLGIGFLIRRSREPAFVRLTSVVWALGTIAVAGALAQLFVHTIGTSDPTTFLAVAAITTGVAAALFAIHRVALQHLAFYVGVLVTMVASLERIDPDIPVWIGATLAWMIGVGWMLLGWRRLVTPWWVAVPVGMITALIAPAALQEDSYAAMFVVGIATAAGLMAFSVFGRFVPGLALGSVGLFGYVTGAVVRYLGDALGLPAALAITGALILAVAALTARLMRSTRRPPSGGDAVRPPVKPLERLGA